MEDMYKRFEEVEAVRDVFIPNKRNKNGQRYGFVRFGANVKIHMIEERLNNIWFGAFKLRANLSGFERRMD
ncbi:hypothetical protein ACS0TY_035141 [Phlomoides rotata]